MKYIVFVSETLLTYKLNKLQEQTIVIKNYAPLSHIQVSISAFRLITICNDNVTSKIKIHGSKVVMFPILQDGEYRIYHSIFQISQPTNGQKFKDVYLTSTVCSLLCQPKVYSLHIKVTITCIVVKKLVEKEK